MTDFQRKRLYDAENSVRTEARGKDLPTVLLMQAYVDAMLGQRWFVARFGWQHVTVKDGGGFRNATAYKGLTGTVYMPKWSRFELVLLHEVTHCLTDDHHGPEFAAVFRFLVGEMIGPEARKALGDAFFDYKVEIDLRAVPKPDPLRWRKVQAKKRERRDTQRAAKTRGVTTTEARDASATIRRAVRAGTFGPAGSKPRNRALAIARLLENQS